MATIMSLFVLFEYDVCVCVGGRFAACTITTMVRGIQPHGEGRGGASWLPGELRRVLRVKLPVCDPSRGVQQG